jgi:hypothetical protein
VVAKNGGEFIEFGFVVHEAGGGKLAHLEHLFPQGGLGLVASLGGNGA